MQELGCVHYKHFARGLNGDEHDSNAYWTEPVHGEIPRRVTRRNIQEQMQAILTMPMMLVRERTVKRRRAKVMGNRKHNGRLRKR